VKSDLGGTKRYRARQAANAPAPLNSIAGLEEITHRSRLCGVYVLCLDGEVQYVGQSTNVQCRIASHKFPWDRAYFLPVTYPSNLIPWERALIRFLQPKLNGTHIRFVTNVDPRGFYMEDRYALRDIFGRDMQTEYEAQVEQMRRMA
jgi:hypothetical protein